MGLEVVSEHCSLLSKDRSLTEQKFFEMATKAVNDCGLSLYDLDYNTHSSVLRLFIWKPETKTAEIDDCVRVDHAMTPYIEEADWLGDDLTLEVSSPGIYRTLKTLQHFTLAEGESVMIFLMDKLKSLENDENCPRALKTTKKFKADIIKVFDDHLEIEVQKYRFKLKYSDIKKANLDPTL